MPKLADLVRQPKLAKDASIEDIVRATHKTARMDMLMGPHDEITHRGSPGLRAKYAMSYAVTKVLPQGLSKSEIETVAGIVRQVLKEVNGAACLHPAGDKAGEKPTWFVANKLPSSIAAAIVIIQKRQRIR